MRRSNEKGQMMVLETIFFASTILLSLIFLQELSPSSVDIDEVTSDLKAIGDDALRNLYNDNLTVPHSTGYPSSKLVYYIINDEYGSFVSDARNLIPSTIMFNVYISNGSKSVFWCNSFARTDNPLPDTDPVVIAHCIIPIDPDFIPTSDIYVPFGDYKGCIYEVTLRMWYT